MRLTKKFKEDYFVNTDNKELINLDISNDHQSSQIIRNKLGPLEDIEDELGIDLMTFFNNYRELLSLKGRNLKISIEEVQKELEQFDKNK